jgi:phosphoglycerol transferase MdoB-like AlkP superfamily enzyme
MKILIPFLIPDTSKRYFYTIFISFMGMFSLFRLIFFLIYKYKIQEWNNSEIALAFLTGVRFDASVTTAIICPFILLSYLNFFNKFIFFKRFWTTVPLVLFLWVFIHNTGDIVYYDNSGKRLGYEGVVFLGKDLGILFGSFALEKPFLFLLSFLFPVGFLTLAIRYTNSLIHKIDSSPKPFLKRIAEFVFLLLCIVILIRGGFQKTALRPSHSYISNDVFINHLGLNPVFTAFYDFRKESIPKFHKIRWEESTLLVRKEIESPGSQFMNPVFPLLRKNSQILPKPPKNIVLIILESWSAKLTAGGNSPIVDGIEVTPEFNKLRKEGIYFENAFANGGRTTNGLLSLLVGIPDRPGLSLVHTETFRNLSLGKISQMAGYESLFITGSDLDFENLGTQIKNWGFQNIQDQKSIEKLNQYEKGLWGFHDDVTFELITKELDKSHAGEARHFIVGLTITTHYPYKLPSSFKAPFEEKTNDHDFLNSFYYSDKAIGDFVKISKTKPWFQDTIFIFVADHTHHRDLDYFEDRHIPILIYSPSRFSPEIRKDVVSQLDIVPTIVSFLDKPVEYAAMGKNMLNIPKEENGAYFAFGNLFGWIEGDYFFYQDISSSDKGVMRSFNPPRKYVPICEINPVVCEYYERKAKAFLNLSQDVTEKNKLSPY